MIIYVRHGHDLVTSSQTKHDPEITEEGKEMARKTARNLLKMYPVPKYIYISPMRRVRQTYQQFRQVILDKTGQEVPGIADGRLSRFFVGKEKKDPRIHSSTKKYNVPVEETVEDMIERMLDIHKENLVKHKGEVIWVISHGLTLKKLIDQLGYNSPEHVDFLEYYIIATKGENIDDRLNKGISRLT